MKTLIKVIMCALAVHTAQAGFSKHGQPCSNSTLFCDKYDFLTCQSSTCTCIGGGSLGFDVASQSCRAKVGSPPLRVVEQKNNGFHVSHRFQCVPNAVVDRHKGICQCKWPYEDNEVGECQLKLADVPLRCTNSEECKSYRQVCISGICQCDPQVAVPVGNMEFIYPDRITSKCAGLAGKPCVSGQPNGYGSSGLCVERATCHHGACKCDQNTRADEYGQCNIQNYGRHCNPDLGIVCGSDLRCMEFLCSCKHDPKLQYYDSDLQRCRSFVWGPCNFSLAKDMDQCTDNAFCVDGSLTGSRTSYCSCQDGFVGTKSGRCELAFGVKCLEKGNVRCDSVGPLFCMEGKCACREEKLQTYDQESRKCLGISGAYCDAETPCASTHSCNLINKGSLGGRGQCLLK